MIAVGNAKGNLPNLKNDGRMNVYLSGNYFQQNVAGFPNSKNADTSKYDYKGYGICFDEGGQFGHTITEGGSAHTTSARNVLIFGADMSFSTHANNRTNNIYVMGELFIQGRNNTTIYAEKKFYINFTDPGKNFILSLHYDGDDSYLFVNGRQELKFKCKTD